VVEYLNTEELEAIRKWPTCAVSNAIELFNIRPRNQGFMLPSIECMYPDLGPMIGYAVTAVMTAESRMDRACSRRIGGKKSSGSRSHEWL